MDDTRSLSHFNLLRAHYQLASHNPDQRDADVLLHHLGKALAYGERVVANEPGRVHYRVQFVRVILLQARVAVEHGDYDLARRTFSRADTESLQIHLADPNNIYGIRARSRYYAEHARAARSITEPDEAQEVYREAALFLRQHFRLIEPDIRQLLQELEAQFEPSRR